MARSLVTDGKGMLSTHKAKREQMERDIKKVESIRLKRKQDAKVKRGY